MKCLIDSWSGPISWLGELMPETAPLMLKIANKPLLEFYVDYCVKQKITAIKVILRSPSPELEEYFGDGGRWGISIGYAMSRPEESLENVLAQNRTFIANDSLLVVRSLFFLHYGEQPPEWQLPAPDANGWTVNWLGMTVWAALPPGKDLTGAREYSLGGPEVPLSPIASVNDYFNLNMRILQLPDHQYVLPGYNNDAGICLGQNVEIAPTCHLNKPVMVADFVQLKSITSIGPNAIIGHNVLIDRATAVSDAIICDHSYVGADLEIRHKIIYRNHLIDPETGFSVDIVDNFLLTNMADSRGWERLVLLLQQIPAFFLFLLLAVPWLLLRLVAPVKRVTVTVWRTPRLDEMALPQLEQSGSWPDRWRRRFCLDKFELLLLVLRGRLFLAGNRPLINTPHNAEVVRELKLYHPAAFPFIETIDEEFLGEGDGNSIYEYYYSNNAGWFTDVLIVVKILLRRLLHG